VKELKQEMMFRLTFRPLLLFFAAVLFSSCVDSESPESLTRRPLVALPDTVPNEYGVILKWDVTSPDEVARSLARDHAGTIRSVLSRVKIIYMAVPQEALPAITKSRDVASIVPVIRYANAGSSVGNWGLDRIDQHDLPLDGAYFANRRYGKGVRIYVLDTGIRLTHDEFSYDSAGIAKTRAFAALDSIGGTCNPTVDDGGHGTHVAALAAGKTYGVASQASVYDVRIMTCSKGTSSSLVTTGINYVATQKSFSSSIPMIANLSLAYGRNADIDSATARAVRGGVIIVSAAGNDKTDACGSTGYSPAAMSESITVAASTKRDYMLDQSNTGSCIDVFAPGDSITSAWSTSNTANKMLSGTSMAAPLVAGAAALYLESDPSATPSTVQDYIIQTSTAGKIQNIRIAGTPNRLLYTLSYPIFVTISGPGYITAHTTATFTTALTGSWLGTPGYVWEEKPCYAAGNSACGWSTLGYTTSSVSRTLDPNCTVGYDEYRIRVTATDTDGIAVTDEHNVSLCGMYRPSE
jgi:aqualysin 1